jgi:mono/diheme cytochrome c family protein
MPIFLLKSILGLVFFFASMGAFLTMLTLMGRPNLKTSPKGLKTLHKSFGLLFLVLLLVLSYICIKYVGGVGDQLSLRAVSHSFLSLGLLVIFFIKITIVRFYKQFLKFVPVLGIVVFSLAFVVTATSAGYYFLRAANPPSPIGQEMASPGTAPSTEQGKALYEAKCAFCHFADREENKMGPGLKRILNRETLPHSGRPAIEENIINQLTRPVLSMPAFNDLSEPEIANLLAYLKTL